MKKLTARTPEDLLAMVPCVLGFHPEQSIVLLTFGDASSTFQARVDLPERTDDVDAVVESLLEPVRRHHIRTAVVVGYAEASELAIGTLSVLIAELEAVGVEVVEALRVAGARWFGVRPGLADLVPEGVAFDLESHPFMVESVFEGRVTHGSREELAESLVGTDTAAIELVEAAAFEAAGRWGSVQQAAEAKWLRDVVLDHVGAGTVPPVGDLGRLLVAIQDMDLRDVAWLAVTRPTAGAHLEFWRKVVRLTPSTLSAPPAAILAFCAWLKGHGALAWCAVDRSLLGDPDYSMASHVAELLLGAIRPGDWPPPEASTLLASS